MKIVALRQPSTLPVLSGRGEGRGGKSRGPLTKDQGISAGFVPDVLNTKRFHDEIYKAEADEHLPQRSFLH